MEDRRIKRTRRQIEKSYLELLDEKPMDRITVKDICDRADINRCTFYAHYENIGLLNQEMKSRFSDQLIEAISLYHYDSAPAQAMDALFDVIRDNEKLYLLSVRGGMSTSGLKKFTDWFEQRTNINWKRDSYLNEEERREVMSFIAGGTNSIILQWIDDGRKIPEETVKQLVAGCILDGLHCFIHHPSSRKPAGIDSGAGH